MDSATVFQPTIETKSILLHNTLVYLRRKNAPSFNSNTDTEFIENTAINLTKVKAC